ncbi:MAG: hypothetical protein AABY53_03690 [Bdellovibrionota bacterium]
MSNDFWVLYNPIDKTQSEKLSTEEAQYSIMRLKTKEINDFLIWRNAWPKWHNLGEYLTSKGSPFMKTFIDKAEGEDANLQKGDLLKMKPVDPETARNIQSLFSNVQLEEVTISDLKNNDSEKPAPSLNFKDIGKPKDKKYNLELLLIHPKGTMLRTIARDISLSGTFCEKIIPEEFHHSILDLVIINNFIPDIQHNRLTLKAEVVIVNSSAYLQYVNTTDQQKESLRAILDYYVRALKKQKPKNT